MSMTLRPVGVAGEEVAELDRGVAGAFQRDHGDDLGLERIVDVHNDDAAVAGDVGVVARRDHEVRAVQDAVGIERDGALEEVVARVAVEQGRGVDRG